MVVWRYQSRYILKLHCLYIKHLPIMLFTHSNPVSHAAFAASFSHTLFLERVDSFVVSCFVDEIC